MVTKDDVINIIMKYTGGDKKKEFAKTTLAEFLGMKNKRSALKELDNILDELLKEGVIKLSRIRGKAKYYTLGDGKKEEVTTLESGDFKDLKKVVGEAVREVYEEYYDAIRKLFEEYFGKPKTIADFDRVYDFVKDDLGLASIRDIREQLGMTIEQFMDKFRDYIIQNYELHSGGKEGIVKGGVLYGIIRKKR